VIRLGEPDELVLLRRPTLNQYCAASLNATSVAVAPASL
jgi:hypothetical protein